MSPMETFEHMLRKGWAPELAISAVHEMMKFPWGIEEDPEILERLEGSE